MHTQHTDIFGAPTRSGSDVLPAINDFAEGFVRYQPRAANILACADAHPHSALANICAAILWMFLERPEAPTKAEPYVRRAEAVGGFNDRERGLLDMVKHWQRHDYRQVRRIADHLLDQYPQDLALVKIAQYHAFNAGDAAHMLQIAQKALPYNRQWGPMHSMLAFAHEQSDQLDAAEAAALQALDIDADEPWAHHALAHVHLGRGTIDEGLKILRSGSPSWEGLNSFMFTHNWWHIALFEMATGAVETALSIYDERCWGIEPEYSQDQIGAVSLLARLELAGVDVGERWQQLQPWLETRTDDLIQPFLSVQYLYGLAKADSDQAQIMLSKIRCLEEEPWASVGAPLSEGLVAHAYGEHAAAVQWIVPVRRKIVSLGGSHAQRDLFEQILLDARLRAGQYDDARKTLEFRQRFEPDNPLLKRRLQQVYQQLGV